MTFKIIFDTDPGVDDAMALYYALAHPQLDLIGITTTFGNVTVQQAVENALYLTALAGNPVPVTCGVVTPWAKPPGVPPGFIHGDDGLGNLPQRKAHGKKIDPRSSAQFIVDSVRANPHEITLVAVGPLGNLALALKLAPEIASLVHQVVIMGGTVVEPGNVSPVAEANIWNDPHAADAVFSAGWPLTMVGLDVTHRVVMPSKLFEKIAVQHQHLATDTLLHAVKFYADFYSGLYPDLAHIHACFGHDVLAFIYLTQPHFFETTKGRIRVAESGLAQGQTMMDRRGIMYPHPGWESERPETTVCMKVTPEKCIEEFEQTLMRPWLKPIN